MPTHAETQFYIHRERQERALADHTKQRRPPRPPRHGAPLRQADRRGEAQEAVDRRLR
ncbi:hypothetical protein MOP88_09350 [Sphingomonas sp. WKB10]|nr:hypothetical protein [Sphingomonas sp. WKB10]